jgi:hypothetical protein
MTEFIKSIAPKLENMNFDDPEQSLKVIILRGLINIIKKMIEEHKLELSESDRKILDDIMKSEEEQQKKVDQPKKTAELTINQKNDDPKNEKGNNNKNNNSNNPNRINDVNNNDINKNNQIDLDNNKDCLIQ